MRTRGKATRRTGRRRARGRGGGRDPLPDPAALVKFRRWITPGAGQDPLRHALLPRPRTAGPGAAADGSEMVDLGWHTPQGALEAHARGELVLVFPTIKHLEQLAGFATATS